jgi:hypothetical protein
MSAVTPCYPPRTLGGRVDTNRPSHSLLPPPASANTPMGFSTIHVAARQL